MRNYYGYFDPDKYRVLRGFFYKGELKKDKQTNRQAWRIHKKFQKDKGKHKGWNQNRPWSKYLKYYGNRKHRAIERKYLYKDPDRLSKTSIKDASNPWDWD